MIFVTVGTQFFDDLIDEVDRLAALGELRPVVLAQIGLARKTPKNIEWVRFVKNFAEHVRRSDMVISHAGTGTLCELIELGKPFIAVANTSKAGNHQTELLEHLSQKYDFEWIPDPAHLSRAITRARPATPRRPETAATMSADIAQFLHSAHQSRAPARRTAALIRP